jgi:hypothetical protein
MCQFTDRSHLSPPCYLPAFLRKKAVLLALLALGGTAQAKTYYVATSGTDSNDGASPSSPWQNISYAISVAGPGDTVNIAAGSYSGTLHFTKSGTASSPIVFQGAGFTTVIKNQVIVSGAYTTLSGMSFQDSVTSDDPAVELNGTNNTLLNCEITNIHFPAANQATALTFGSGSNNTANGVQIHDIADIDAIHVFADHSSFLNGQEYNIQELNYQLNHTDQYQTWAGNSETTASYFTFAGNICTNNSCQGGNTETDGSSKLHDWYIYNNIFNHTDASFFSGLPKTYIANNIYINGGNGGAGVQVCFYTISAGTSTGGNSGKSYDSSGSWVQNNCWIANAGGDFGVNGSVAPKPVANNYFASSTSWTPGKPQGTGAINGGDPGFVNAAAGDYHLSSTSILRGKGTNLSYLFTTDKDGRSRPATGPWDIGPYQSSKSNHPAPRGKHVRTVDLHRCGRLLSFL